MKQDNKYPELDKIKDVQDTSHVIGQFLDWLSEKALFICDLKESGWGDTYKPIMKGTEKLIADYLDIDLDKAEKERVKILEDFRKRDGSGT